VESVRLVQAGSIAAYQGSHRLGLLNTCVLGGKGWDLYLALLNGRLDEVALCFLMLRFLHFLTFINDVIIFVLCVFRQIWAFCLRMVASKNRQLATFLSWFVAQIEERLVQIILYTCLAGFCPELIDLSLGFANNSWLQPSFAHYRLQDLLILGPELLLTKWH